MLICRYVHVHVQETPFKQQQTTHDGSKQTDDLQKCQVCLCGTELVTVVGAVVTPRGSRYLGPWT